MGNKIALVALLSALPTAQGPPARDAGVRCHSQQLAELFRVRQRALYSDRECMFMATLLSLQCEEHPEPCLLIGGWSCRLTQLHSETYRLCVPL